MLPLAHPRAALRRACLPLALLALAVAPPQSGAQTASHDIVAVVADVVGIAVAADGSVAGVGTRDYRVERERRGDVEVVTLILR